MKPIQRIRGESKRAFMLPLLVSVLGFTSSCKKPTSPFNPDEIRPQNLTESAAGTASLPDPETGFLNETFTLPVANALSLLKAASIANSPLQKEHDADPFAASDPFKEKNAHDESNRSSNEPLHQAFENLGIPFAAGTSATYDSKSGRLTVVQSPEAMGLIRQVLAGFREIPRTAAVRFEFYEVPALLALRLEQSSAPHFDDTPEWEALQNLLSEDEVRLLDIATLQTRSGERSKFEDGESFIYQSGWQSKAADDDADIVPVFEDRFVGTMIEIEIVIGADGHTIDLNFMIEYHSAPPEFVATTRDPEDLYSVPATVFHMKKLVTNFTLHDGEARLLTSWTPTGQPEYKKGDRRILVFVTANLQRDH